VAAHARLFQQIRQILLLHDSETDIVNEQQKKLIPLTLLYFSTLLNENENLLLSNLLNIVEYLFNHI
jgi:hypothetical protein